MQTVHDSSGAGQPAPPPAAAEPRLEPLPAVPDATPLWRQVIIPLRLVRGTPKGLLVQRVERKTLTPEHAPFQVEIPRHEGGGRVGYNGQEFNCAIKVFAWERLRKLLV